MSPFRAWSASWWRRVVMAVGAVLLAGCSTVETRIAEYPELFRSLDPDTRANILSGAVELGYSPPMAYIALGNPDEVRRVTRREGELLTWLYQYSYPVFDGYGYHGYHHHFVHTRHGVRVVHLPTFYERYRYETRDYLRLEFERGRLVSIERIDF